MSMTGGSSHETEWGDHDFWHSLAGVIAGISPHASISTATWKPRDSPFTDDSWLFDNYLLHEEAVATAHVALAARSNESAEVALVHIGVPLSRYHKAKVPRPYAEFFLFVTAGEPLRWAIATDSERNKRNTLVWKAAEAMACDKTARDQILDDSEVFEKTLRKGGSAIAAMGEGCERLHATVAFLLNRLDDDLAPGIAIWNENPPESAIDEGEVFWAENLLANRTGELATALIRTFKKHSKQEGSTRIRAIAQQFTPPRIQGFQRSELGQLIISLPTPLSQFVSQIGSRTDFADRDTMDGLSAYERLVAFTAFVVAGVSGGLPEKGLKRGNIVAGTSLDILARCCERATQQAAVFERILRPGSTFMTRAKELKELRNQIAHGKLPRTEDAVAAAGARMYDGLGTLCRELAEVLKDWSFLHVEESGERNGQAFARGVLGEGPAYQRCVLPMRRQLLSGLYLYSLDADVTFNLSAHLRMKECAACECWELFQVTKLAKTVLASDWQSLTTSHTLLTPAPRSSDIEDSSPPESPDVEDSSLSRF
jgi:hypothetical protein